MEQAGPPRLARRQVPELAGGVYDVIVVGGGITGAGVARHAAACGLTTLLLEADDFAAGTSSRSTKLIHGGLRYLAMGDFALVREGALERKSLLAMAPHLIEPRWMLVPARNRLAQARLRLGISVYEWLGAVPRGERHRNWNGDELAAGEPLLDRARLPRACVYREFLTDDARLVLATLRSAAAQGADVCNYAPAVSVTQAGPECLVEVDDQRSGERCEVRARCVVNAAGPWVEALLQGDPAAALAHPRLYLSKGVHLVLPRQRLPVRNMVMMSAPDGRPVFAIARGAVTYVGTTDTAHGGAAVHWPAVTAADIDYLLTTVNAHFRVEPVTAGEVLATWAGLRPLIHQPGKAPKEMSRRDEIWRDGALVTVAGGKLTGFRRMAEETMKAVGEVLGRPVEMPRPLATLAGGDIRDVAGLVEEVERRYRLERPVAARLVRLYGSEVWQVLGERPSPLSASVFGEEIDWAVEVEGARTLEDVVYRRVRAAWFLPAEVQAVVTGAAGLLADRLQWNGTETESQTAAVRRRLADELGFRHSAVSNASR
jgi:glycerol-3-phosphate dehydrogenase